MNLNLIKKLSTQAQESIPKDAYEPKDWIEQYNINLTKLIVNECIRVCDRGTQTQTTSSGAALMIKQHFNIQDD